MCLHRVINIALKKKSEKFALNKKTRTFAVRKRIRLIINKI